MSRRNPASVGRGRPCPPTGGPRSGRSASVPGRPRPLVGLATLGLALVLTLSACGVTTGVAVTVHPNGTGTVAVTVGLDRAAQVQAGDLASQLQTSDLAQAGWTVSGPRTEADGTEVVSATKAFVTPTQAAADVASLAGSGPEATRPFRLHLTRQHTFFHTTTQVGGAVDLTCGVDCFGDAGLQKQLGSAVGVDVGALSAGAGETPAQALTFSLTVSLPGRPHAAPPATVVGGVVTWKPVLGHRIALSARSTSLNTSAVTLVAVAGGLLLVVLVALIVWAGRRGGRNGAGTAPPRTKKAPQHAKRRR